MKYYASDIIKKARIAADLVNSDFIDWYEEVSLLNDSYQSLYQNLVEINDPSFVKIIETTDKRIQLPDDFHQLRCVTLLRNGFSTPILRRSFSESYNSMSYEILGSELHINTPYVQSPPDGVYHIEYFASPATLLFPNEDKNITTDIDSSIFSSDVIASNTKFVIEDMDITYMSSPIPFVLHDRKFKVAYISKDNMISLTDDYDDGTYYPFARVQRYKGVNDSLVYNTASSLPVIFDDGAIGLYFNDAYHDPQLFYNTKTLTSKNASDILLSNDYLQIPEYFDDDNRMTENLIIFAKVDLSDIWSVDSNGYVYHFDEQIMVNDRPIVITQPYYKDGILYGISSNNFITFNSDNTISIRIIDNLKGIEGLDENTGYGFIIANDDDEEIVLLKSWVNDTLLDYPNSFFFQTITYALAVQYKIKQNADASGLQAIYTGYYDNFMKSLPQDVYMPSRINNVYTY